MKVGAKKGREEIIHLPLDATCLFLVDVGSATGYLTHHSIRHRTLTAKDGTVQDDWEKGGKKRRLNLQNVCAGQGADVFFVLFFGLVFFGFSLAFVFKRQSTVKTQQNGHVSFGPPSDFFPCSFVFDRECEI